MEKQEGVLRKNSKGLCMVETISKKGVPVSLQIPKEACYFDQAEAQDGDKVLLERESGKILKVTIEGKPVVSPVSSSANASQGGGKGRQFQQNNRPGAHGSYNSQTRSARDEGGPAKRNGTAPFNFIPHESVATGFRPPRGSELPKALSGRIDCKLTALTPLLVCGPQESSKGDTSKDRRFFQVGGKPVIPATSIKGLLRSTLETLSFSRLFPVSSGQVPYRGVGDLEQQAYQDIFVQKVDATPRYRPRTRSGFLRLEGASVYLTPCEYARLPYGIIAEFVGERSAFFSDLGDRRKRQEKADKKINNYYATKKLNEWLRYLKTTDVGFELDTQEWHKPGAGRSGGGNARMELYYKKVKRLFSGDGQRGTVVFTGHVPKKSMDFVFYNPGQEIEITLDEFNSFREQMTKAQKEYWNLLRETAPKRIPIFYVDDPKTGQRHLGLAQLFRIPSEHSPTSLLKLEAESREDSWDLAQCIFGFTGKKASLRGRVLCSAGEMSLGSFSPELHPDVVAGQPGAGCAAFYLVQPETVRCRESVRNLTNQVVAYNSEGIRLRGRKQYWHRNVGIPTPPNDNMNVRANYHPLKSGVEFTFSIRYESLTEAELGALLSAIELPDGHAHKLGLGKPFGFGSVRLEITELESSSGTSAYGCLASRVRGAGSVSKVDREQLKAAFREAVSSRAGIDSATYFEHSAIKTFLRMTDFKNRPANGATEYMPLSIGDTQKPSYRWRSILPSPEEVG